MKTFDRIHFAFRLQAGVFMTAVMINKNDTLDTLGFFVLFFGAILAFVLATFSFTDPNP